MYSIRYFLLFLSLFFPMLATASDSYNPTTGILTIPSVTVGGTTYNNLTLKLNNAEVLSYNQNPAIGLSIYDDPNINITLTGSSRVNPQNTGASGVNFSLLITNKTSAQILIAEDNQNSSILTDNNGVSNRYTYLTGINATCQTCTSSFSPINAGSSKVLSYSDSYNYFLGNTFNYSTNLWVYSTATAKTSGITFSFTNVAIN